MELVGLGSRTIVSDDLITHVTELVELFFWVVNDRVKHWFERLVVFTAIQLHLITVLRIIVFCEFLHQLLSDFVTFINKPLIRLLRIGLLPLNYQRFLQSDLSTFWIYCEDVCVVVGRGYSQFFVLGRIDWGRFSLKEFWKEGVINLSESVLHFEFEGGGSFTNGV